MNKMSEEERKERWQKYYKKHRQREIKRVSRYYREKHRVLREKALEYYGGDPPKCDCCGEHTYEFLSIDHMEGGGNKHRKSFRKGKWEPTIYQFLSENNYPDGFRVLCYNCNFSIGHYGFCPHEETC